MWFITLLILALAAFFIIKAVKAHSARQSAEQEQQRLQEGTGLAGSLNQEHQSDTAVSRAENTGSETNGLASASAVAGAAATAAAATTSSTAHSASSSSASRVASGTAGLGVNTGDDLNDAREMIKILNLAEPDAGRLAISGDQFSALRAGNTDQAPSSEALAAVTEKLRRMLA